MIELPKHIDIEKSIKICGNDPRLLKRGSDKKVISICESCYKIRQVSLNDVFRTGNQCHDCVLRTKRPRNTEYGELDKKNCTKCKIEKSFSEFCLDNRSKDKHSSQCKECKSINTQENHIKIKSTSRIIVTEKRCLTCKVIKIISDFGKSSKTKDRLKSNCKACRSMQAKNRNSTLKNRTEFPEIKEKYCPQCKNICPIEEFRISKNRVIGYETYCKKCSNIRARCSRRKIQIDVLMQLYEFQNGKCYICQIDLSLHDNSSTIDHDHNIGDDAVRGILCRPCNTALGLLNENIDSMKKMIIYPNSP